MKTASENNEQPGAAPGWSRWLLLSGAVVVLDQLTKFWVVSALAHGERIAVLPVFSWVRWHNEGAAFSMLADGSGWQRWMFVALAIAFTGFILLELRRLSPADRYMGVVYGLVLGGALGNMIDRLLQGHVVDFLLVHYRDWYFPAFNVADMALSVGAGLWILALLLEYLRARKAPA